MFIQKDLMFVYRNQSFWNLLTSQENIFLDYYDSINNQKHKLWRYFKKAEAVIGLWRNH